MARIATLLLATALTPVLDTGLYNVSLAPVLPAAGIANGDYVPVFTITRNGRIVGADLTQKATLGAGATVKLSLYRGGALVRDLTAATAGGGAGYGNSNALGPLDCLEGDEVVIVVGGAGVTAAATVEVDVQLQH